MRTTLAFAAISFFAVGFSSGQSAAQPVLAGPATEMVEGQTTININESVVTVSGRLSLGLAAGKANEIVYSPSSGALLSKLTWDIDTVVMVGGGITVSPNNWIRINGDIAVAVTDGNGSMDDYDWMLAGYDWTDHSHHDDAPVDSGLMLDINAEFPILQHTQTVLYAIAGFKHENWSWKAWGGQYLYSSSFFRDTAGSFPSSQLGISYEQTFNTPYVGIGFQANLTPITLSGRFIASTIVSAEDEDQHHVRNMLYTEDFDGGTMIGVDLAFTYPLTDRMALTGNFHYQQYDEMKGEMTMTNLVTGQTIHYKGDVAGIDQHLSVFSLALDYNF